MHQLYPSLAPSWSMSRYTRKDVHGLLDVTVPKLVLRPTHLQFVIGGQKRKGILINQPTRKWRQIRHIEIHDSIVEGVIRHICIPDEIGNKWKTLALQRLEDCEVSVGNRVNVLEAPTDCIRKLLASSLLGEHN
eukprot:GEZU01010482.1.p1 GENE.GEZU01010482.1~~GEZU01010482.1.p1  ORF type:complete len:134 (-),score=4.82 GEZU01010482.1:85-486(-)